MFLLSLVLATSQPDTRMLMNCDDFDWLSSGVWRSELLTREEKLSFISVFIRGTDPACFKVGK